MIHIIYTYKGKVYSVEKDWTFERAERALTRLGAEYWEIGIPDLNFHSYFESHKQYL